MESNMETREVEEYIEGSKKAKIKSIFLIVLAIYLTATIPILLWEYWEYYKNEGKIVQADKPIIYLYPEEEIEVSVTKGLSKEEARRMQIPEQKLETPERKGFVAVEWGGSEIE